MSRTARPIQLPTGPVTLLVPWLHAGQRQVYTSPARFKIVVCGRQWGKTTIACVACIEEAAARGGDVWWVAPHYKEGELAWRMLRAMCRPYQGVRFEGRPIFRATFPGGGTVQVRSAEDPDALRGATLTGVVLDEAAQIRETAWNVVRPTLAVRGGWAMFISTPRGLNWFYDLYNLAGERDEWARWRFPSTMNPRFSAETWDLERAEMHPLIFAQEYEAEFVQASGTVFRREWFRYYYPAEDASGAEVYVLVGTGVGAGEPIPADRCSRFATVDLAFSTAERADYTVIASWAVTPDSRLILLGVEREHMEGERFLNAMESVYGRYRLGHFAIESAAKQRGLIRDAERLGLPVREVRSDSSKESRALPAAARMERSQVFFPQGAAWMRPLEDELLAFPAGAHDDFVDALAYAVLHLPRRSAYERRGPLIL